MMTGELKAHCIQVLQQFVDEFKQVCNIINFDLQKVYLLIFSLKKKKRKSEVTDEILKKFMDPDKKIGVNGI